MTRSGLFIPSSSRLLFLQFWLSHRDLWISSFAEQRSVNDLVVVVCLKHLVTGFELWIMLRLLVLRNKDSAGKKAWNHNFFHFLSIEKTELFRKPTNSNIVWGRLNIIYCILCPNDKNICICTKMIFPFSWLSANDSSTNQGEMDSPLKFGMYRKKVICFAVTSLSSKC